MTKTNILQNSYDHVWINCYNKVWIPDPRWSWYGTPLWRCWAIEINIKYVTMTFDNITSMVHTKRVYFTSEEYVYFKLDNISIENIDELRKKGIVYS